MIDTAASGWQQSCCFRRAGFSVPSRSLCALLDGHWVVSWLKASLLLCLALGNCKALLNTAQCGFGLCDLVSPALNSVCRGHWEDTSVSPHKWKWFLRAWKKNNYCLIESIWCRNDSFECLMLVKNRLLSWRFLNSIYCWCAYRNVLSNDKSGKKKHLNHVTRRQFRQELVSWAQFFQLMVCLQSRISSDNILRPEAPRKLASTVW